MIGLAGFGVSLLIHIVTVLGIDVSSEFRYVWMMHVAAVLYFAFFVLSSWSVIGGRDWNGLRDFLPGWLLLGYAMVLSYTFLNFFVCADLTGSGNATILGHDYLLMSHGRVLAHLTESGYHLHKAYELRMFSGAWIIFWCVPLGYFLFHRGGPAKTRNRLFA